MGAEPVQDWHGTLASALEWWRDAGVDMLVEDEARDWLARPAPRPAPEAAAPAVAAAAPETLPDTLDAFLAWRLGDAAPEAEWMAPRVAPAGPADAEWVIVTDVPEEDDPHALLGGAAGRLFDRMLAAIGLSRESVHVMSVAVARPLAGRIPPEEDARLADLARHQLGLLKPRRLLLLVQAASRVVPEASGSAEGNPLQDINHFGAKTLAVASYHPRFLLERPAMKSEAWKHLLLLSRGTIE
jgi:uracil-DNA glycosylase